MSGETEEAVSGWTTDTLREHLEAEVGHLHITLDDRFAAEKEAIRALFRTELDVLRERLAAMDKAAELLNEQVTSFPTDVQQQVGNLKELHGERFSSIDKEFSGRDTAVAAAFAAQKEAAAAQNKANTDAIGKSENATNEAIANLSRLLEQTAGGIGSKIEDMKERLGNIEKMANGTSQRGAGIQAAWGYLIGAVGLLSAVVALVFALRPR